MLKIQNLSELSRAQSKKKKRMLLIFHTQLLLGLIINDFGINIKFINNYLNFYYG